MKNYTITVNGNVYDVTVEEKGAGAAPQAPRAAAPAQRLRQRQQLQRQRHLRQEQALSR